MKTLLLNWLYYPPVGHVVEALKLTKGYHLANPDLEIHLLLNGGAPVELAEACPWIKKTYPVFIERLAEKEENFDVLKHIPKEWDYIITDDRASRFGDDLPDLIKAHYLLNKYLVAKIQKGHVEQCGNRTDSFLPCIANPQVILDLPKEAKEFADNLDIPEKSICIMLGGSAGLKQSPSVSAWLKICQSIVDSIPDIKIYFTGVTKEENGRTSTKGFSLEDVDYLVSKLPNAQKVYNVGLWNQVALIEKCKIFISPHTGFAFLAPLVGTKWLEIATCPWPAYVFNDIPFYSVLPDCGSYPSKGMLNDCGKLLNEGKKATCVLDEKLEQKIPEIVEAVKLLLSDNYTYERAINDHLKKVNEKYNPKDFFFFGGLENIGK